MRTKRPRRRRGRCEPLLVLWFHWECHRRARPGGLDFYEARRDTAAEAKTSWFSVAVTAKILLVSAEPESRIGAGLGPPARRILPFRLRRQVVGLARLPRE